MSDRPPVRHDLGHSPADAVPPTPESPRRRTPVSQQTVTAVLSSAVFVVLVLVLAVVPVPYVGWTPGRTVDLAGSDSNGVPALQVEGLPTTPINGELRLTTVSQTRVDSRIGLLEAMLNHALPHRDVLPRKVVYPPGTSGEEVKAQDLALMRDAQSDAVVAALRAAGQPVSELPMVVGITLSGPALNRLQPGDMITKVDGQAVQTVNDVSAGIQGHRVGEPVVFTVQRGGQEETVTVTTVAAPNNPQQPYIGIRLGVGYRYDASVTFGIDPNIGGPSAGAVFALAIYDLITEEDLLGGQRVAGTGGITPAGKVTAIGGIQQKIRGAEKAGAQVFLVPADNCQDVAGIRTSMELVKADTLREAIGALQKLKTSKDGTGVPRC
ncbi:YlbL family protein [Aestuariimicrobium sp. Y1814]|uniref:YlbL family protein n=1 Tax=Aestuariimicrobium sp. Y1814 TaxID=3418742 RepID=UPI003DA70AB2